MEVRSLLGNELVQGSHDVEHATLIGNPRPTLEYRAPGWTDPRVLGDVAELLRLSEALQLLQRLVLDLADALTGDVEGASNLVECAGVLPAESVAKLEHAAFAIGEVLEG